MALLSLYAVNYWIVLAVLWALSWLMISTYRYPSFKDVGITRTQALFMVAVLIGAVIFLRWNASAFFMAPLIIYMLVGIKNRWLDWWQDYRKARAKVL